MKNIVIYLCTICLTSCVYQKALDNYVDEKNTLSSSDSTKLKNSTPYHIEIINPSFEVGTPNYSQFPLYWDGNCGFEGESPPDVHFSGESHFNIKHYASQGNQFLSMVTRQDNTFEAISQQLIIKLETNAIYQFSLDIAHSETMESPVKNERVFKRFNTPIVLRIWIGTDFCERMQLVFTSSPIDNVDWQNLSIPFISDGDYTHITLEAYYDDELEIPYNGNILIDNISPIVRK